MSERTVPLKPGQGYIIELDPERYTWGWVIAVWLAAAVADLLERVASWRVPVLDLSVWYLAIPMAVNLAIGPVARRWSRRNRVEIKPAGPA